ILIEQDKFEYNIFEEFEEFEEFMELDNSEETDKIIGEFRTADMTIPELSIKLQEHSNIVYTSKFIQTIDTMDIYTI
ncbi:6943_t:CDS:1, partial [Gigaspora rosea]